MFRLASISKLFTWTAVMQLVEQGKLDLDADINRYLDFAILGVKPITLRNLMTHTTGFEEVARDILVTDPKRHLDLREFLVQNQPHRLFAPGTVRRCAFGCALRSAESVRSSSRWWRSRAHIFRGAPSIGISSRPSTASDRQAPSAPAA
jgi:hypothetical protein